MDPETFARLRRAWERTGTGLENYGEEDVAALLDGLEVQPPGVGPVAGARPGWESARGTRPGQGYVIGAIGVKR